MTDSAKPGGQKRRAPGEDSIYLDGDRWRGAVSLGWNPDGSRRRVKVSGRSRGEVVRKLKDVRKALDAGLPPPDVDFEARLLMVRRGLKRVRRGALEEEDRSTHLVLGEVKTRGSRRNLPLTAPVVQLLLTHRAGQAAERLAVGPAWADTGLVFTTPVGTPIDPDNFSREFSAVCQAAGLGRWHLRELRHSGVVDHARPRGRSVGRLRDARALLGCDHQGRLRAPTRRREAQRCRGHLWGAVQPEERSGPVGPGP